jgi:hypothetical protein
LAFSKQGSGAVSLLVDQQKAVSTSNLCVAARVVGSRL